MAVNESNQCRVKFRIDKETGRIKDMEVSGGSKCNEFASKLRKNYEGW